MEHSAPQHEHAPRPLPLFLDLVRDISATDPDLARDALKGLRVYSVAQRVSTIPLPTDIARVGGSFLRDYGGDGPPLILVPSLINPPHILDLDQQVSLVSAIRQMGRHVLLLDWGSASERAQLSIAGHVEHLLVPLVRSVGEPTALVGYCLGGTMAIAAANLVAVERVATLASPWHFSRYPDAAQQNLQHIWSNARPAADALGVLPMEVLQAIFWSLDPHRTVAKFSELAELAPGSDEARRFVALEDWANEGEPLPLPAAHELMNDFFERDVTGRGAWFIGTRRMDPCFPIPMLHLTAARDRISPASTAPPGQTVEIAAGHVGMVVGRARQQLHHELARFVRLAG